MAGGAVSVRYNPIQFASEHPQLLEKPVAAQLPSLVSLFLCDELIHDARSRKTHVFGLFDSIRPRSFPHRQARVGVFVALTGVAGHFAGRV